MRLSKLLFIRRVQFTDQAQTLVSGQYIYQLAGAAVQSWALELSPSFSLPVSANKDHIPLHIQAWLPAGQVLFPLRRKLCGQLQESSP